MRERYVRLGLEVCSTPCSRLLSSATVDVSDKAMFEAMICVLLSESISLSRSTPSRRLHAVFEQLAVIASSHLRLYRRIVRLNRQITKKVGWHIGQEPGDGLRKDQRSTSVIIVGTIIMDKSQPTFVE